MHVCPDLETLELLRSRHAKLFSELHFICFLVYFVKSFGDDGRCMHDSCDLRSEEVSLSAREYGVAIDRRVEFACEDVLYLSSSVDERSLGIRQLHPVLC